MGEAHGGGVGECHVLYHGSEFLKTVDVRAIILEWPTNNKKFMHIQKYGDWVFFAAHTDCQCFFFNTNECSELSYCFWSQEENRSGIYIESCFNKKCIENIVTDVSLPHTLHYLQYFGITSLQTLNLKSMIMFMKYLIIVINRN